jgi:hypothetical protein
VGGYAHISFLFSSVKFPFPFPFPFPFVFSFPFVFFFPSRFLLPKWELKTAASKKKNKQVNKSRNKSRSKKRKKKLTGYLIPELKTVGVPKKTIKKKK